MKKHLLSISLIMLFILCSFSSTLKGQTVIASWSFDALVAPTSTVPTVSAISADFGPLSSSATAYLDGTNGSSLWSSTATNPELTTFSGNVLNDPRTTPAAGMALALANSSANGKYVVFKFSTIGYYNISASFATRGTATGFNSHAWAWSIDNITYTDLVSNPAVNSSTWALEKVDLSSVSSVNNTATVYLRLTVTGSTAATGNNRIDNFVVYDDVTGPVSTIAPTDAATDVAINVVPTITFDEAVKNTDASEITDVNLSSIVKFKKTNSTGEDVACTMTIDAAKKVITITPTAALDNSQAYYIECGEVDDAFGNTGVVKSSTFTTIGAATPAITLTAPVGGETFYAGDGVTFTWTSANISDVKIEVYFAETSTYEEIIASTPAAAGSYEFTIPVDADYSAGYKIKISDVATPTVFSESGAFTVIGVATSISDLRSRFAINDVVKLNSEAIITYINGKNYYVQDPIAGVLVYDNTLKLTTTYAQYDGVTGITGTLANYNGVLEFIPITDAGAPTSTANTVTPLEVNIVSLNSDPNTYESRLIKVTGVTFADAGVPFVKSTNYNITDGTNTTVFRAAFATSDIIGTTIPKKADLIGLAMEYNGTAQIASRNLADMTIYSSLKAITAFAFNGLTPAVVGTVDETAKTVSATVPAGTVVNALVPTITVSDKATVAPLSGVANDFTNAVTYTVTAEDGTTQEYVVTVTILTGFEEKTEAVIAIGPVPAKTCLNINNIESVKLIEIFNVAGVKVETVRCDGISSLPLSVEKYKPGYYFIRFTTSDGVIMKKFIKQ